MERFVEVCCDSVESAITAERAGASRVELCSALALGGLTPSYGLAEAVRAAVSIDINILIRPRPGDFVFSTEELEVMIRDIQHFSELGIQGAVTGALNPDRTIDTVQSGILIDACRSLGLSVTFHRAIDLAPNIIAATETVSALGVDRILSSGGERSAYEGRFALKQMCEAAQGGTIIMPGCGISPENIASIATETGASEFHLSAGKRVASPQIAHSIQFTPEVLGGDTTRVVCDAERLQKVIAILSAI